MPRLRPRGWRDKTMAREGAGDPSPLNHQSFWTCGCGWFNVAHPERCTECGRPRVELNPTKRGGD